MPAETHADICLIIDKSLAGAASDAEQRLLGQHLSTCDGCAAYLSEGQQAVAALGGFSFELEPDFENKVMAGLASQATAPRAASFWRHRVAALVLTAVGSLLALLLALGVAKWFAFDPARLELGVVTFWITPSICFCLLLLLLTAPSETGLRKKGLV